MTKAGRSRSPDFCKTNPRKSSKPSPADIRRQRDRLEKARKDHEEWLRLVENRLVHEAAARLVIRSRLATLRAKRAARLMEKK